MPVQRAPRCAVAHAALQAAAAHHTSGGRESRNLIGRVQGFDLNFKGPALTMGTDLFVCLFVRSSFVCVARCCLFRLLALVVYCSRTSRSPPSFYMSPSSLAHSWFWSLSPASQSPGGLKLTCSRHRPPAHVSHLCFWNEPEVVGSSQPDVRHP